jgi:nucleotide-binding universal stress UspA family protein
VTIATADQPIGDPAVRAGRPAADSDAMSHDRPPHRFLVSLDESVLTSETIDLATRLARKVSGSVTLFAVVPLAVPPGDLGGLGPVPEAGEDLEQQEQLERLARERLADIVARIGDGLDMRTKISSGPAGPAIVDEIEQGAHDLVVVPTRREGELGHLVHDHTLRHVLHHSAVPVLVVPAGSRS